MSAHESSFVLYYLRCINSIYRTIIIISNKKKKNQKQKMQALLKREFRANIKDKQKQCILYNIYT